MSQKYRFVLSFAGIPKAGMPSWDTDSAPPQSEVTSRQSSAGPQSGFSNLANPHTQPAAITPLSQPKRRTAPQHDPLAQSSWQGSSMRAEGSAADPFAVLPATIAQPGTSLQGSDLFLHPHSMLSAPGTSGEAILPFGAIGKICCSLSTGLCSVCCTSCKPSCDVICSGEEMLPCFGQE